MAPYKSKIQEMDVTFLRSTEGRKQERCLRDWGWFHCHDSNGLIKQEERLSAYLTGTYQFFRMGSAIGDSPAPSRWHWTATWVYTYTWHVCHGIPCLRATLQADNALTQHSAHLMLSYCVLSKLCCHCAQAWFNMSIIKNALRCLVEL